MGMARVPIIAHYVGPQPFGVRLVTACGDDYEQWRVYAVRSIRLVTCPDCRNELVAMAMSGPPELAAEVHRMTWGTRW